MNEAIGTKGGKRDRKRTIIITKRQEKALLSRYKQKKKQRLKKLEQEVRRLQLTSFFIAVPISIAGNILETITATVKKKEQKQPHIEENRKEDSPLEDITLTKQPDIVIIEEQPKKTVEVKEVLQQEIPIPIEQQEKPIVEEKKQEETELFTSPTIQKVTDKKIVTTYEGNLKDIKQDLKDIVYEYQVLETNVEELQKPEEAEEIIEQLDTIIEKLEELKEKIKVEQSLAEDPYIEELVEEYIEDFKNKKEVDAVKDSSLYIMLSSKVEEAKKKAQTLSIKVNEEKENLSLGEEEFTNLKEEYYNYNRFNIDLLNFQNEQDKILQELEQKVSSSTTETEKIETRLHLMTRQSKKLLGLLAIPMMIPGNRSAKAMATATIAYLYFMHNLLRPKKKRRRYRIIEVKDYSKEIEGNISKIEDVESMLNATSTKLEEMIKKIRKEFAGYSEQQELLQNLQVLLKELQEKERQLQKQREKQQELLAKNKEKVKILQTTEEV